MIINMKVEDVFSILDQNRDQIDESFWKYYQGTSLESQDKYINDICRFIEPKGDILSIGCGHGLIEMIMAHNFYEVTKIIGIDIMDFKIISMNTITAILNINNVKGAVGDAENLDFPDESFNVVMLIESLSHVNEDIQVLKEAARVLKSGGRIFVLDLNNGVNPRIIYKRWRHNRKLGLIDENPVNPYHVKNRLNEIDIRDINLLSYKSGRFLKKYDETFFQKMPIWFQLVFSVGFMLKGVKR
jgi:ubiquinone/menaquinone biosynthesis C-methylase UbiE